MKAIDLSQPRPLPPEWIKIDCDECDYHKEARGTLASRRALELAQKHANRMHHRISIQHANRR